MSELSLLPQPLESVAGSGRLAAGVIDWVGRQDERVLQHATRLELTGLPLTINISASAEAPPQLGIDESYRIAISNDRIVLTAPATWGALHGLTSLKMLQNNNELCPGVHIHDAPRFEWRGLLIDVARHFMSIDLLERVVDGMAMLKLNVLHLHLTDDQAFRLQLETWPKLAATQCYTTEQVQALVRYAADRGVRIVPEIDVPGHVTSWLTAYPELALRQVAATQRFGVHQACLNPTDERTYVLLGDVFSEVSQLFPDRYVHLGGDEVHPAWWSQDTAIAAFIESHALGDVRGLQNHFNHRLCDLLTSLGKMPVGWDEVLHPNMPQMVVQNWRGATTRNRALVQGMDCIVSAPYYLDLHYPAEMHYAYDPMMPQADWLALEDADQADVRLAHVAAGIEWTRQWRKDLVDDAAAEGRVLGGEACLWSELVDEQTLEVRLWGRLPAVAERLWSAADVVDTVDFYRRLTSSLAHQPFALQKRQAERLQGLGLTPAQCQVAVLLEPVKWYARLLGEQALRARLEGQEMPQARPYDLTSEYSRVVDHISPESLAARAVRDMPQHELLQSATRWQGLAPESWPDELRPAIAALAGVGKLVIDRYARDVSDDYEDRLMKHYVPLGEYMLAVVPHLLARVDR